MNELDVRLKLFIIVTEGRKKRKCLRERVIRRKIMREEGKSDGKDEGREKREERKRVKRGEEGY